MRILLTGATGFVGRALCLRLERDRHQVVAWVRDAARARHALAASVEVIEMSPGGAAGDEALAGALGSCDAIVHLAGEAVIGPRWTEKRREALHASRVGIAARLVGAMSQAARAPGVFVSASAVGYYGDRGNERLVEATSAGDDFLAQLCVAWERAADAALAGGARVVCLRTGIVLGPEGGVLDVMRTPFLFGLGGRLGSGRQFVPWIHIDDLLEMYVQALVDPAMRGAYNATAPEPVTNGEFTRAIGRTLHRPTPFPVPKPALFALLGRSAAAPLASQRAIPARLLNQGFRFAHTDLGAALREILEPDRTVRIAKSRELPDHPYLKQRRPTHLLEQLTLLGAPLEEVAPFFSQAENLGTLTPPGVSFRIESPRPIRLQQGTRIDYTIRLGPLELRWRTVIEIWNGSAGFSDAQERGPFRCWWHEHSFERHRRGTLMRDRVFFAVGWGWIGRAIVRVLVAPRLRRIFGYRARAIAWRFGARLPTI